MSSSFTVITSEEKYNKTVLVLQIPFNLERFNVIVAESSITNKRLRAHTHTHTLSLSLSLSLGDLLI